MQERAAGSGRICFNGVATNQDTLKPKEPDPVSTLSKMIKIGGFLAVALAVSPPFTGDANAYACKGVQYSSSATKTFEYQAKADARKKWEHAMRNEFGLEWSVWTSAENASFECHNTGTRTTCLALARPCKYVVQ